MRHKRAEAKLRLLAEGCEGIGHWPPEDELYLAAMSAFGDVLEGTDPAGSRTRDGATEWSGRDRAGGRTAPFFSASAQVLRWMKKGPCGVPYR